MNENSANESFSEASAPAQDNSDTSNASTGWDDEPQGESSGWDDEKPKSEPKRKEDKAETNDKAEDPKPEESKDKEDEKPKETRKKKYIKVGDQVLEESEIGKLVEKAKGADRIFREAAAMRKKNAEQMHKFLEGFKNDPQGFLSHPKLNIPLEKRKEIGEALLSQALEHELGDPRDLELKRFREEEKQRLEEKRRQDEELQSKEMNEKVSQRRAEISESLARAMELTPLSKDPATSAAVLREMATYLRSARQQGENPTPEEIAQHVHEKRHKEYYALAQSLEGQDLIDFLGPEVVKKIASHHIKTLKAKRSQRQKKDSEGWERQGQIVKQPPRSRRLDPASARERVRKNLGL